MPNQSDREPGWFALPLAFARDPKLLSVPPSTRYLFLELVALAIETGSGGRIDGVQLMSCGRGMRALRSHCGRLSVALLLRYCRDEDAYYILDDTKWLRARHQRAPSATLERRQSDTKATSAKSVSAAQNVRQSDSVRQVETRAGAHVEKERKKEREEERTPSGSVRSSSAQAAPRVAGGAAQPAQKDHEKPAPGAAGPTLNGRGTMSRAEAIAFARSEVSKGRKNNSAATGIDTEFSKYDPDRPIEPITSAMKFDEDPE